MLNRAKMVVAWITIFLATSLSAHANNKAIDLLFNTPYLDEIKEDLTILYDIELKNNDTAKFGQTYSDTVRLNISVQTEPKEVRNATIDVYSGQRERHIGPFGNVHGNPALMVILEQDTFSLNRRLGGIPAYFRNRIRAAFREKAQVKDVEIDLNGETIAAQKVSILPFEGDANMSKAPDFQRMTFEFIVADTIPGGIYSINSFIKDLNDADKLLYSRSMTFKETQIK